MEPSDEAVEAGARAIHAGSLSGLLPWDECDQGWRNACRIQARAALAAAYAIDVAPLERVVEAARAWAYWVENEHDGDGDETDARFRAVTDALAALDENRGGS